jgi:diaminohydroxyphosphoribosylaminopyrimidine deaminase/5-amino-6-(5-phosphoribosylamino)uracil reductase
MMGPAPELNGDSVVDASWMRRALDLAARGQGSTSPNPMVGAVIVRDGVVLGEGFHVRAGEPHAEVHALRAAATAGHDVRGATIYVSLEPCCHQGRTGPCTEALIGAGIGCVVIAQTDPNPLVAGQGAERLRAAGIEVKSGLMADEAATLNRVFSRWILTRRPWVTLKMAVTLDGRISPDGRRHAVTGAAAMARVMRLRATHDLVLVGAGTARVDNPRLTARGEARGPLRGIIDTRLELGVDRALFETDGALVVTAALPTSPAAKALVARGVEVLSAPSPAGLVDLPAMLAALGARTPPVTSVLVEGGGRLAGALLASDLVDELAWFVAPSFFGARGISATGDLGVPLDPIEGRFALSSTETLDGDVLLTYLRRARP